MRLVCISDTHTFGKKISVPDGDVLIHAGDHTFRGTESEIKAALRWLESLPHPHKIFIAGNHDWFFDLNAPRHFRGWSLYRYYSVSDILAKFPTLTYLQDSSVEIDGVKFYGSPWQPYFYGWAFNFPEFDRGVAAKEVWARIPETTDVLITHSPPANILDLTLDGQRQGCRHLRERVEDIHPKVHVFGHIHESYGVSKNDQTISVNAAICNRAYDPINPPIVLDI